MVPDQVFHGGQGKDARLQPVPPEQILEEWPEMICDAPGKMNRIFSGLRVGEYVSGDELVEARGYHCLQFRDMDVVRDEPGELSQEPVGQRHIVYVVKYLRRGIGIGLEKVLYHYSGQLFLKHAGNKFPADDSSSALVTENIAQGRDI
jgi:hypothetical protein